MQEHKRRVHHNAPSTQRKSFRQAKAEGLIANQKLWVLQFLHDAGMSTSRAITEATGIERPSVTKCLSDLEAEGRIYVIQRAPCPTTRREVQYYAIKPEEPQLFAGMAEKPQERKVWNSTGF